MEVVLSSALLLLLLVAMVRMLEDAEREAVAKSEIDGLRAEAMNTANAMTDPFWVLCMNYVKLIRVM